MNEHAYAEVESSLLRQAFRDPESTNVLSVEEANRLLRAARRYEILPRLSRHLEHTSRSALLAAHLDAARNVAMSRERSLRQQVEHLRQTLVGVVEKVVLLKGAAYLLSELPFARGRRVQDLDILVARRDLGVVEQRLCNTGWETLRPNEYDENYYRRWMHELPPFRHQERGTVLDVHHTILPITGRVHPNADLLLDDAVPVETRSPLCVLRGDDMILHAAAHVFQDGQFDHGFRDLLDLDGLLRHLGAEKEPWLRLVERAKAHELERSLYYAARSCSRVLGTPVPEDLSSHFDPRPAGRVRWAIMARLIESSSIATRRDGYSMTGRVANGLLYLRSHWLRMPLRILIPHLLHQMRRRLQLWSKRRREKRDRKRI